MTVYFLQEILNIQENLKKENTKVRDVINEDTEYYIYTLEYKFKDRRNYKAKNSDIKPITFADIRVNLNKLSKKNYGEHFKCIIATLHVLNNECTEDIFKELYKHLSRNCLMVDVYTKLTLSLIDIFPEFKNMVYGESAVLLSEILSWKGVKSCLFEEECEQNKEKDRMRANIIYISKILNNEIDKKFEDMSYKIVLSLQNRLIFYLESEKNIIEYRDEGEFIAELLLSVLENCCDKIKNSNSIKEIKKNVDDILGKKKNKTISRKIIFKCMSINEKIK